MAVVDDHFLAGGHVELVDGAVAGEQYAPAAGLSDEETPPPKKAPGEIWVVEMTPSPRQAVLW